SIRSSVGAEAASGGIAVTGAPVTVGEVRLGPSFGPGPAGELQPAASTATAAAARTDRAATVRTPNADTLNAATLNAVTLSIETVPTRAGPP
ncbi:MAG: hypothetical protein QOH45_2796, partial [Pseudonocardiales bacterium]|nr:hypothetical protein [Pseudonocardiales bacterium]